MNESKASRYHRLKRRTAVLSVASAAAVLVMLLTSGASITLRDLADSIARSQIVVVVLYVIAFAALLEAVSLPLAYYSNFVLEHRYELSASPASAWLRDHLKAFALSTSLLLIAAEGVYALIRWSPEWWWLPAALLASAAVALLARLAPVLLMPIFYKFKPLERASLAERLVKLSRDAGVRVLGVYEWGLGEKTRRANAALVGSGRTRRILLSDTLLAEYTDDEIEVILAHELAHHVHHDIPRALLLETLLLIAAGYAAAAALQRWWVPLGITGPADVAGFPLLMLAAGVVMVTATPLVNAFSRSNERRADRYALQLTRRTEAFITAMRRLASQNLIEDQPSRPVVWLFHSHPPIAERIEAARTSAW